MIEDAPRAHPDVKPIEDAASAHPGEQRAMTNPLAQDQDKEDDNLPGPDDAVKEL